MTKCRAGFATGGLPAYTWVEGLIYGIVRGILVIQGDLTVYMEWAFDVPVQKICTVKHCSFVIIY